MDLSTLLGHGMADYLDLAQRMIAQLVDRVGEESFAAGDEAPAERIAAALGNRLARVVLDEEAIAVRYDVLAERNVALAAALGACDCWGDDPDCAICDGDGRPGWLPPDPQLFAVYVRPVAASIARPHQPHINHQESNHD
jgi:hypothetical protein